MQTLFSIIASLIFAGGSFIGIQSPEQAGLIFGDYNPTGGGTYRIQSSLTSSQSTITLTSFKEPQSGIKYTMAYLNSSIEYGTIEPQSNNKEFVSFTGINQNADGTATLTGVTRGLGFSFPYTASSTLQVPHSGQSIFILSNPPQLTNMYANKSNTENIDGIWGFATAPYDYGFSTSSLQFATRAYVNGVGIQGAATSTVTQSGIGILATGLQAANGTYGSLLDPHFLSTLISTSTYFGNGSYKVVVTGANNTIDPNFIATTSVYKWTGANTHTGGETFSTAMTTFNSGVALNATTTINASKFVGGFTNLLIAGETITGGTLPQPVYIATSTATIFVSDADVAVDKNFIGFAVSDAATGNNVYVQTDGIVGGFSGLTAGLEYFVQDVVGTLGTTVGTAEIYVGSAISTSQILVDQTRGDQLLLSSTTPASNHSVVGSVPLYTRKIIVKIDNLSMSGTDSPISGTIVLTKNGLTSARMTGCDVGTGNCGAVNAATATWGVSAGIITLTTEAAINSGDMYTYYYR